VFAWGGARQSTILERGWGILIMTHLSSFDQEKKFILFELPSIDFQ
jgi:hypothetical protein